MIASLVDIDNQGGRGDFEFGKYFLDLAVPRVSHFTEKDDWVNSVGFGLDKVKVFGSVGTGWVKVEDRLGIKREFRVKRGKSIGSGSGDELVVSKEDPSPTTKELTLMRAKSSSLGEAKAVKG